MTQHSFDPSPRAESTTPRYLPLLLVLFVGSGCSALIYEIVWLQLLQLIIGSSSISLGILLGTFMGGMCLGSLLLPVFISRARHPLRVYAFLELAIGGLGLAVLYGLQVASEMYTGIPGPGLASVALRSAIAGICLIPPTLLMGATLPAISRWVETTPQGVSWLGFFYGGNIAGAVIGCLLAGFYLLRLFDMATATYVAVAINCIVAAIALVVATLTPRKAEAAGEATMTPEPVSGAWAIYVAIALSGFCALGGEVIWTRLMSLMLGGTVYSFSIILAVFLIGLGIGSSFGSMIARRTRCPRAAFGICQLLVVAAIAWTAYMISNSLPYWPIDPFISQSPWYTYQLDFLRTLWALLPPACLWGASFPLALSALATFGQDPGRLVGRVYAANTVGAIFGSLAFSMFLIPLIGTVWSEVSLMAVATFAGVVLVAPLFVPIRNYSAEKGTLIRLVAVFGLAFVEILGNIATEYPPTPPWGLYAYGRTMATYFDRLAPGIDDEKYVPWGKVRPDEYCTYVGEGRDVTVAVTLNREYHYRRFHGAGKVQASSQPEDMRLQRLLGHISALAHKKPENVLVVACGAGVTAGCFTLHPDVKKITICDIEPLVPTVVTPKFAKENYNVIGDPRTHVVFDDGRHFIRATKDMFDIISSDPIDPYIKGCAALNTVEYYQMCKDHLNPGGVMSLWIPIYASDEETVKSVIATFFQVFPDGILWTNDSRDADGSFVGYDAVLFGQTTPTQFNLDDLQAKLDSRAYLPVKRSLEEVRFGPRGGVAIDMLSTFAAQPSHLKEWMQDAQINYDKNMRLQYLAGMSLNVYKGKEILAGIVKHYEFPSNLFVGSPDRVLLMRAALADAGRGR